MNLQLEFRFTKSGDHWKDPLISYLDAHCAWIARELSDIEFINDMPTLFTYLVDLQDEFITCNPNYKKPYDFQINYHKVDDQEHIHVGYHTEKLIINEIKKL